MVNIMKFAFGKPYFAKQTTQLLLHGKRYFSETRSGLKYLYLYIFIYKCQTMSKKQPPEVFLQFSQYSQENICGSKPGQVRFQDF